MLRAPPQSTKEEGHVMFKRILALAALSLLSLATLSAPAHGDVRETGGTLQVWHKAVSNWITPDEFFVIEIERLEGPTYGTVGQYPPSISPHLIRYMFVTSFRVSSGQLFSLRFGVFLIFSKTGI